MQRRKGEVKRESPYQKYDHGVDKLDWEKDVPQNSEEYIRHQSRIVDTSDILEVTQVYMYKEPQSAANDYVCLQIQLKHESLIRLYGGCNYLFQIWKNKERLYQHPHKSPISAYFGSKTEIAYLINDENEETSIVYVVRQFNKKMSMILNPFAKNNKANRGLKVEDTRIYINSEVLLISNANKIKGIDIKQLFQVRPENEIRSTVGLFYESEIKDEDLLLSQELEGFNINQSVALPESNKLKEDLLDSGVRAGFIKKERANEVFREMTTIETDSKSFTFKDSQEENKATNNKIEQSTPIRFQDFNLPIDTKILAMHIDVSKSHKISIITSDYQEHIGVQPLSLITYIFSEVLTGESLKSKSLNIESFSDTCIKENSEGDYIVQYEVSGFSHGNDNLATMKTHKGEWYIMKQGMEIICSTIVLAQIVSMSNAAYLNVENIKLGFEGAYMKFKASQKSFVLPFDDSQEQIAVKMSKTVILSTESFVKKMLTERFVRLHVELFNDMKILNSVLTLAYGESILLLDLSHYVESNKDYPPNWIHYSTQSLNNVEPGFIFGKSENEIDEIHYAQMNSISSLTLILVYHNRLNIRKVIYHPNLDKIMPLNPLFKLPIKYTLVRACTQFNTKKYKDFGECRMGVYFEAKNLETQSIDIYKLTLSTQIIKLARNLDPNLTLVKVLGASPSLLFLANTQESTLSIYKIPSNAAVIDSDELELCLSQRIPNFTHKNYITYFLFDSNLSYVSDGNLIKFNLVTGETFTISAGMLTQIHMFDNKGIFFKDRSEKIYQFDRSWFEQNIEEFKEGISVKLRNIPIRQAFFSPIVSFCQNSLLQRFEGDPLSQITISFIDPMKIQIFNNLSAVTLSLDGSANFYQRHIAFNMLEGSLNTFHRILCAYDNERGTINSWNIGTGKICKIQKLKENKYKEFKYHGSWDGSCLISKHFENQQSQQWIKLKVSESQLIIESQFRHKQQISSTLFVSSNNKLMLEFLNQTVNCFAILESQIDDICKTQVIASIKFSNPTISSPIYFSPDFSQYFDVTFNDIKFYKIPFIQDYSKISKKYTIYEAYNVPEFDQLAKNQNGQHLVEFVGNTKVRYITQQNVEHIVPITEEMENRKDIKFERFAPNCVDNKIFFSRVNDYQFLTRMNQGFNDNQILDFRSDQYQQQIGTKVKDLNGQIELLQLNIPGNCRSSQTISFSHWKLFEVLEKQTIDFELFCKSVPINRFQELLDCILPSGDTFFHLLLQDPSKKSSIVEPFLDFIQQKNLNLRIIPNLQGVTALHLCVGNSQATYASRILKIMSKKPLDDHSRFINDLMPDLLKLCSLALADYIDSRMITVQWTPQFTEGSLNKVKGCDFAVIPQNLFPLDIQDLKNELFEDNQQNLVEMKFPISVSLTDLPDLHHFSNETGKQFLKQLSMAKYASALFNRKYIQALIEIKWPPIRSAIIKQIFIPYLVYLGLFNFYALYLVYQDDVTFLMFIVQSLMIALTLYTAKLELREFIAEPELYFTHPWNFLDILPKLMVLLSMGLDYLNKFSTYGTLSNFVVSLNAISMFLMWINILNFLRLFRNTGYLIHLILQVILDMKYFLAVIGVVMLSFSGSFYILSRSNPPSQGDFLDSSYLKANGFVYQLLLGSFDSTEFGDENLVLTWIFFILATLILIVVMLNLLISIISDTFSRVQVNNKTRMYSEFASLIIENYHLLSEDDIRELDSRGRYLYIAWLQDSGSEDEAQTLTDQLSNMLQSHRKEILSIVEERLSKDIKEALKEAISSSKKDGEAPQIEGKIDSIMKEVKKMQESIKYKKL